MAHFLLSLDSQGEEKYWYIHCSMSNYVSEIAYEANEAYEANRPF